MNLRISLTNKAKELEFSRQARTEKPPTDRQFWEGLNQQFARIVNAHMGTLKIHQQQLIKEVQGAWEEFMVADL